MPLPFFYTEPVSLSEKIIVLNEENSKHIVQVLRMEAGEQLKLTDGRGNIYTARIADAHKKKCTVIITDHQIAARSTKEICIAVSPVKNSSRFEWFLEKATETGVSAIVPLLCNRTERQHLRQERLQGILISAMLQSQQAWLPVLSEPIKYENYIKSSGNDFQEKFIAHCDQQEKISLKEKISQPSSFNFQSALILIGPEGDFTKEEIAFALENNFVPVALGNTRLRTETAAIVAATLLCID